MGHLRFLGKLRGTAKSKMIKMHWVEEENCGFSQIFKCHYATGALF